MRARAHPSPSKAPFPEAPDLRPGLAPPVSGPARRGREPPPSPLALKQTHLHPEEVRGALRLLHSAVLLEAHHPACRHAESRDQGLQVLALALEHEFRTLRSAHSSLLPLLALRRGFRPNGHWRRQNDVRIRHPWFHNLSLRLSKANLCGDNRSSTTRCLELVGGFVAWSFASVQSFHSMISSHRLFLCPSLLSWPSARCGPTTAPRT